ncbi:hypothetical protein ATANTOWER_016572 [Ataeniobius toweri]|uniref:Uncharacterized protein n=1 Tax=Ataeniobius toweri TaxID=208326 RepID=A0ABU7ATF4_9TELE|nr:hypothetical protein [Ataeniobius toweri]
MQDKFTQHPVALSSTTAPLLSLALHFHYNLSPVGSAYSPPPKGANQTPKLLPSSVQGLRHTHFVVFVIYFKQVQKSENKHFTMPVKKDKPTHFKPSELMLVSVITCSPPPSGAAFRQQGEAKPNRR